MESDRGPWQQTFSGVQFFPLDPRPEEVRLEDIAHALSLQCRFAGHCKFFYSVAEHSVRASKIVADVDTAAVALLHDAAEAYLIDVPTPVKTQLTEYKAIENRLLSVIFERFHISGHRIWNHPTIKRADAVMLATEKRDLMGPEPAPWDPLPEPLEQRIVPWSWRIAEIEFFARARELGVE